MKRSNMRMSPEDLANLAEEQFRSALANRSNLVPYSLDDWPGQSRFDVTSINNGVVDAIGVAHFSNEIDVRVRVAVGEARKEVAHLRLEELRRTRHIDRAEGEAIRAQLASDRPWNANISTDGSIVHFDCWGDQTNWYGCLQQPNQAVIVKSSGLRPEQIAIRTITEFDPFFLGSREYLASRQRDANGSK